MAQLDDVPLGTHYVVDNCPVTDDMKQPASLLEVVGNQQMLLRDFSIVFWFLGMDRDMGATGRMYDMTPRGFACNMLDGCALHARNGGKGGSEEAKNDRGGDLHNELYES